MIYIQKDSPILFILLILIFTSCAPKKPLLNLGEIDTELIFQEAVESSQQIRSISGMAKVSLNSPGQKASFKQVTIMEKPNLFYIEAFAPFGRAAIIIKSNGQTVYLISDKEETVFDNIDDFDLSYVLTDLPVGISTSDIVNLFLASIPTELLNKSSNYELKADDRLLIYTIPYNEDELKVWIDPVIKKIVKFEIPMRENIIAEYQYQNYFMSQRGILFPKIISLNILDYNLKVNYYEDINLNGVIDKRIFANDR